MSSSREVFKSLKKVFPQTLDSGQNHEIALKISIALISEGLKPFQADQNQPNRTNQGLLSELNPSVVNLVFSNSQVPIRSRLSFFEFLRTSQSSITSKPDLQAHVTLAQRLFEARRFAQMKNVVKSIVIDDDLRCPVSKIVALIESNGNGKPKFVEILCDMAFRVYVSNDMFEEALEVFDYTEQKGISIEERSCFELLIARKKSNRIDLCLQFFDRMVQRGIQITVYSLTIAIDCLCRIGDIEKAKVLISDLARREIVKPNVFTYNTVAKACIERKDFDGVNEVLRMMERDNVGYNAVTFTLLIEWYGGCGKIEEAFKLFDEMCERGTEPDVHVYTSLIKWTCKVGNLKRAFSLFDELVVRGLVPSVHTYGSLINGLCKAGQMEAAEMLVREMESKGMGANQVVFNMLMDGYCRKGMIDRAMWLKGVMESKGLEIDIFCYNSIASGLCNLNRNEEAKRLLFLMAERGVSQNFVSFTTLIDIYCKDGNFVEAKWVLREMEKKGEKPNVVTYNALIDGYSKKGKMEEAHKLKYKMALNGMKPDSYTYTSLIHGECIAGNVDKALKLFNEMSVRGLTQNVVTYTAMISGLSREGRTDEAFKLYNDMINAGLKPDDRVYTSLATSIHTPEL